jgi:hypothetical protein
MKTTFPCSGKILPARMAAFAARTLHGFKTSVKQGVFCHGTTAALSLPA